MRVMASDSYFNGKVALVTGAASGIGRALSAALAARGGTVVLADVDEVGAKATADAIAATGARAVAAALDVRDAEAFSALVDQIEGEQGPVELLFNNAGIGVGGPVRDMTVAHWDRTIDVNLRGVANGVMACYPRMCDRGRGHIVNTASLAGLIPAPLLTPYAATKHAVVGLSTSLRAEAAGHGVRVSVVCPGVIDTPLLDKGNPKDLPPTVELPNGRKLLGQIGKPYPPGSLAENVLDGVAANRVFIVAPRHARLPWRLYRLSPDLLVRGLPIGLRRAMRILAR
jgi:NAD(P)-dependent dehydrogenase (short-subunit alcohol dehydrogenase family)